MIHSPGGDIMPTKNARLNVVLEPALYEVIRKMARKSGVSMSLMARDLLKQAIELQEDVYWNAVAEEREKSFSLKDGLSHDEVWR